ncbi:MAG: hypothetical protein CMO81_05875 [Waddliaceae bacterium]|nr:hypothetical protein [Waddliaceae bacterium]
MTNSSYSICTALHTVTSFFYPKKAVDRWEEANKYFDHFNSKLKRESEETQLLLKKNIEDLKGYFEQRGHFAHAYEHQALRYDLCSITEKLNTIKKTTQLWKSWRAIIENLNEAPFFMPDGRELQLDCRRELATLDGTYEKPNYKLDLLNQNSPRFIKDFEQIYHIILRNFSGNELRRPENFLRPMTAPGNKVLLARNEKTNDILGAMWLYRKPQNPNTLRLAFIGRHEDGAGLGIGRFLLSHLVEDETQNTDKISLKIRANKHRIQKLYEDYGFKKEKVGPYYEGPKENAYTMRLYLPQK